MQVSQSDFVSRGNQLVAAGQFQEAVKVCRLGLLGRPTTVEGRIVLGRALLALSRFDEVLAEMRVALELDPSAIAAYVLRGEALLGKRDPGGAIVPLRQALALSPGDGAISSLVRAAELAQERNDGRPSQASLGYVDLGYNVGGHDPKSDSDMRTAPFERDVRTLPHKPAGASARWPGRTAGTVEVDPEVASIELDDEDVVEAPAPAPGRAAIVARNVMMSAGQQLAVKKEVTVALSLDEMVEMEPDVATPAASAASARALIGKGSVRQAVGLAGGPIEAQPARQPGFAPAAEPPRPVMIPQLSPLAHRLAAAPDNVVMGPQFPIGPSAQTMAAAPMPTGSTRPTNATGPRDGAMPTRAPHLPTLALSAAQAQSAAAIDDLFAPEPRHAWANAGAISTGTMGAGAGANLGAGQYLGGAVDDFAVQGMRPVDVVGLPAAPAPVKRRKMVYAGWAVIGAFVLAAGVFAGLWIRQSRLRKQVAHAIEKAGDLAKDDSWRGHISARDVLANVVKASDTQATRGRLLVERALLAYEFGEDRSATTAAVLASLDTSSTSITANAYIALLQADGEKARALGKRLTPARGFEAVGLYVEGRGALLQGDHVAAAEALRLAVERDPRPLYQLALAEAKIAGGAVSDADTLLATTARASSPEATVLRARGDLRADRLGSHPELAAQLDAITITAEKAVTDPVRVASQLTVALALAVVAETQARSGELERAQSTFGRAMAVGVDDYRFAEQTVRALIALRRLNDARKAAERAAQTWPTYAPLSIALADIELRSGDVQAAFDRLKDPRFGKFVEGATIRGRAALVLGDLELAQDDLDAVLKIAPQAASAMVARAYLEVLRGDGKAAMARLGTVGSDASPSVLTVYGAAQRMAGQAEAIATLRKAAMAPAHDYSGVAHLELARSLRDSGELTLARTEFTAALALGQQRARLEQAVLDVEDRHLGQGRTELEAMYKAAVASAATDHEVDGVLLVELLRARTLSGDIAGAEALLKIAERRSDLPKWQVLRERGRVLMKKSDSPAASAALIAAMGDKSADAETFLLVANVVEGGTDTTDLAARLKAASTRLAGTGELEIINGKLEYAAGRAAAADAAFAKAKDLLTQSHASSRRLAMAHVGLAATALDRNDEPRARAEINIAMSLDPSSVEAKLFGSEFAATANAKLELLQQAVELAPYHAVAWMLLGQAALAAKNKAQYDRAVGRLTDIAPLSQELTELKAAAKSTR